MLKTQINPAIIHELFASTPNAVRKGQAQYFTPKAWSEALSQALPKHRPFITDLTCGRGTLLAGAVNKSTEFTLGCELDPGCMARLEGLAQILGDLTLVYPLLHEVDWRGDCFVLNPPFDHHWPRERLKLLDESDTTAVVQAFDAWDGRTPKDAIDSTVATLCIALDRSSNYGEGFLIGNESTLQRLVLGPNAPHQSLARHIWAHLVFAGNICDEKSTARPGEPGFQTGVIYFAKSHVTGCRVHRSGASIDVARMLGAQLQAERLGRRNGTQVTDYMFTENAHAIWKGVGEEWERRNGGKVKNPFNLWLAPDGTIGVYLSVFDSNQCTVDKAAAQILFELLGKRPINLVVQKSKRLELENAAFGDLWRVDPALQTAVREAMREYHSVRAPLYPLPEIQRLGYLDEQDTVQCRKDLGKFRAGHSYSIRTQSVKLTRTGEKVNLEGGKDDIEFTGQELALFITGDDGREYLFMEARLRQPTVKLEGINKAGWQDESKRNPVVESDPKPPPIDFTLQDLCAHFTIPELPDVATLRPEEYERNLNLLTQIESLCP